MIPFGPEAHESDAHEPSEWRVYSVTGITREIKRCLEEGFPPLGVEGEISNCKRHSSGHLYFSLKDAEAQIPCVMWRGRNLGLAFQARDDLLGIWGSPVETGKPAGSDLIKKKKSLPICFGLQNDGEFRRLYAVEDVTVSHLQKESKVLSSDGAYDFTIKEISKYSTKARMQLENTRIQNENMVALLDLANSLNVRKI